MTLTMAPDDGPRSNGAAERGGQAHAGLVAVIGCRLFCGIGANLGCDVPTERCQLLAKRSNPKGGTGHWPRTVSVQQSCPNKKTGREPEIDSRHLTITSKQFWQSRPSSLKAWGIRLWSVSVFLLEVATLHWALPRAVQPTHKEAQIGFAMTTSGRCHVRSADQWELHRRRLPPSLPPAPSAATAAPAAPHGEGADNLAGRTSQSPSMPVVVLMRLVWSSLKPSTT